MNEPLRELALMICRRGQTIYGPDKIVDICSKTGVSLLEDASDEDIYQDSDADLLEFVKTYAKLGPPARFTILVLSRLLGVSLPEELTRKKMTLTDFIGSLPGFFSDLHRELLGGPSGAKH